MSYLRRTIFLQESVTDGQLRLFVQRGGIPTAARLLIGSILPAAFLSTSLLRGMTPGTLALGAAIGVWAILISWEFYEIRVQVSESAVQFVVRPWTLWLLGGRGRTVEISTTASAKTWLGFIEVAQQDRSDLVLLPRTFLPVAGGKSSHERIVSFLNDELSRGDAKE